MRLRPGFFKATSFRSRGDHDTAHGADVAKEGRVPVQPSPGRKDTPATPPLRSEQQRTRNSSCSSQTPAISLISVGPVSPSLDSGRPPSRPPPIPDGGSAHDGIGGDRGAGGSSSSNSGNARSGSRWGWKKSASGATEAPTMVFAIGAELGEPGGGQGCGALIGDSDSDHDSVDGAFVDRRRGHAEALSAERCFFGSTPGAGDDRGRRWEGEEQRQSNDQGVNRVSDASVDRSRTAHGGGTPAAAAAAAQGDTKDRGVHGANESRGEQEERARREAAQGPNGGSKAFVSGAPSEAQVAAAVALIGACEDGEGPHVGTPPVVPPGDKADSAALQRRNSRGRGRGKVARPPERMAKRKEMEEIERKEKLVPAAATSPREEERSWWGGAPIAGGPAGFFAQAVSAFTAATSSADGPTPIASKGPLAAAAAAAAADSADVTSAAARVSSGNGNESAAATASLVAEVVPSATTESGPPERGENDPYGKAGLGRGPSERSSCLLLDSPFFCKENGTDEMGVVLRSEELRSGFKQFLSKRWCAENVDFIEEVMRYQDAVRGRGGRDPDVLALGREIEDKFLGKSSPNEVNIGYDMRALCMTNRARDVAGGLAAMDTFNAVAFELLALMAHTSLRDFMASAHYATIEACLNLGPRDVRNSGATSSLTHFDDDDVDDAILMRPRSTRSDFASEAQHHASDWYGIADNTSSDRAGTWG